MWANYSQSPNVRRFPLQKPEFYINFLKSDTDPAIPESGVLMFLDYTILQKRPCRENPLPVIVLLTSISCNFVYIHTQLCATYGCWRKHKLVYTGMIHIKNTIT